MKTLLIYPPCFSFLESKSSTNIPLGLPYLSAYLKKQGREVSILDLNMKMYLDSDKSNRILWHEKNHNSWVVKESFLRKVLPRLQSIQDKWADNILKSGPKIVGFYISSTTRWMALSIAKKLKQKDNNVLIIFGGPDCYKERAEEFLGTAYVDAVVIGEGEVTLSEIIACYEKAGRISSCPGAFFRINGKIIYGGQRELINDLDILPYPDFSDLINDYKAIFGEKLWLSISWLRGCPHRCVFCYETRFWGRCRGRLPQSVVNEFIYQENKYGIRKFHKADSTLAVSQEQLEQICDLLIEAKLDVKWYSQARAEGYLTLSLLQKMRKSGCKALSYGVESGSQSVIDRMNKGLDLKTEQEVIINTDKAGIGASITIMAGALGETIIDFIKSIWFILKNAKSIDNLSVSAAGLFPMSDWYLRPEKYGIVKGRKCYYFWRSKYCINNRYARAAKKYLIGVIYNIIIWNRKRKKLRKLIR